MLVVTKKDFAAKNFSIEAHLGNLKQLYRRLLGESD
jgi:hypothetical protein